MRAKNKPTGSQGDSSGSELLRRLNFIQTSTLHRDTISNVSDGAAADNIEYDFLDDSSQASDVFDSHSLSTSQEPTTSGVASTISTEFTPSNPSKRRRQDKEFEVFMKMQNEKLDTFKSFLAQPAVPSAPPVDELHSFFRSMEESTRKLPSHLQRKIKRGLSTMVYDAEEENENENFIVATVVEENINK